MGKKLALLIGVSNYLYENSLPPCEKDIDLMSFIIDGTQKYDSVLVINQSPKSSEAKEKISSFIRANQNQEIEEILIYYTGHGTRKEDDFLYLFSDFNGSKIEQTSLRNSELDLMIKSINPSLAVKIIDACQAGVEYIKSTQDLQAVFEKSARESFRKTYFFFSSSNSESSIALEDFSVFTKSFAKSLLDFKEQDIRYRDIMAFISDDQSVKKHQTPLFVQQADNTEIFCNVSMSLAETISSRLNFSDNVSENDKVSEMILPEIEGQLTTREQMLVQAIKEKGKLFCSEEEAQCSLKYFEEKLLSYSWPVFIAELFNVEKVTCNMVPLDSKKILANWIKDNNEGYFVELLYEEEEYQVKEKVEFEEGRYGIAFGLQKRVEYQPVTKYRKVIGGYRITAPSPDQTIMFIFEPKEQILPWFKIFFTYVFSKSKFTLFYKFEVEKDLNWESRLLEEKNQWQTKHCKLKVFEEIESLVVECGDDIVQGIRDYITGNINI